LSRSDSIRPTSRCAALLRGPSTSSVGRSGSWWVAFAGPGRGASRRSLSRAGSPMAHFPGLGRSGGASPVDDHGGRVVAGRRGSRVRVSTAVMPRRPASPLSCSAPQPSSTSQCARTRVRGPSGARSGSGSTLGRHRRRGLVHRPRFKRPSPAVARRPTRSGIAGRVGEPSPRPPAHMPGS
jgi:hypothetical protein